MHFSEPLTGKSIFFLYQEAIRAKLRPRWKCFPVSRVLLWLTAVLWQLSLLSSSSGNLSLCTLSALQLSLRHILNLLGPGQAMARAQLVWEAAARVKILLFLTKINFFKENVDKAL